jgi:RimJ/RimL family protein N-acetyltransferase
MDVEIRTPRLRLRPQVEADIPAIIDGLNDWEVARWLTVVPYPYTQADADEWMARQTPPVPDRAHFAIDAGTGLVGVVTIDSELGYWLASVAHRHGYVTEACVSLLEWHFNAMPDHVVPSGYHVGNAASATTLTRAQFFASPSMRGRM